MLKEFRGHTSYVNSAVYSPDGASVISASSDATVRVWSTKSSECMFVFRPPQPTSSSEVAVNAVALYPQNVDQVGRMQPARTPAGLACTVAAYAPAPAPAPAPPHTQVLVSTRSSTLYLMTLQGQVVKSFQSGKRAGGDFLAFTLSPRGEWAYALGEDGVLYCFSTESGKLEHLMQVAEKEAIGVTHHPHRNLVATFAADGSLKTWKP